MKRKILLTFIVILILGFTFFSIYTLLTNTVEKQESLDTKLEFIAWTYTGTSWNPESTAPACPNFSFEKLFDTNSLDSLTLPGYFASEEYLPYSKLNFTGNDIDIYLPIDTYLVQAGSYFDGAGDIQYRLNFLHPCGILLQYDHLATISNEIKPIFDKLPKPLFQSKAIYDVEPVFIPAESKIATKIGIYSQNEFFFDFAMYDLSDINTISQNNISWFNKTYTTSIFSHYGICWLEYLGLGDQSILLQESTNMDESDYCSFIK